MRIQKLGPRMGEVNVTFKELMHRIMDQIKNEPYFRWPNKMRGPFKEELKPVLYLP